MDSGQLSMRFIAMSIPAGSELCHGSAVPPGAMMQSGFGRHNISNEHDY
jgi:hypothetical protein